MFTYLNDVLIFSQSWEEHLEHLNITFNRYYIKQVHFFKTQLHYLRHKISADRLEPMPEKPDAIKNLAPAKNVDEAHQILGLSGYYQSFTQAFADITIPITNLLKKNVPFNCTQICQAMLDYLKEFFVVSQYCNFPNLTKIMYYIHTLQTMLTLVFYANPKITIMPLGQ